MKVGSPCYTGTSTGGNATDVQTDPSLRYCLVVLASYLQTAWRKQRYKASCGNKRKRTCYWTGVMDRLPRCQKSHMAFSKLKKVYASIMFVADSSRIYRRTLSDIYCHSLHSYRKSLICLLRFVLVGWKSLLEWWWFGRIGNTSLCFFRIDPKWLMFLFLFAFLAIGFFKFMCPDDK